MSGTVVAYIVNILLQPIITRIYPPDVYGVLGLLVTLVSIFSIISSFSYDKAIFISENEHESKSLYIISVFLTLLVSATLYIVLYFFAEDLFVGTKYEVVLRWIYFIPFLLFLNSFNNTSIKYLTKLKSFKLSAGFEVVRNLLSGGVKITLGLLFGASVFFLLGATLLGSLFTSIFIFIVLKRQKAWLQHETTLNFIKIIASKYKRFPFQYNWSNLINGLSQHVAILILSFYYSMDVVGAYSLCKFILSLPITFIGEAFTKVFLPHISENSNDTKQLRKLFKNATKQLFLIGIIPFSIIAIWGSQLFTYIFGQEWLLAGRYAQVLAPWLFLLLANQPSNAVFVTLQKFGFLNKYNFILISSRVMALWLGVYYFDEAFYSLLFFSSVGVIFNLFFIFRAYILVGTLSEQNE